MKLSASRERGQALILIVLAIVGLIAVVGLAIDTGSAFSDRRHAQSTADAAALAGALAKIQYLQAHSTATRDTANAIALAIVTAKDRAATNGYDGNLVTNTVEVFNPPQSGQFANCDDNHFNCKDYVQVVIHSTVETSFAKIIGVNQINNRVEAVALAKGPYIGPMFKGNAIVSLKPTGNNCPGEFIIGGSGIVNIIGGGIWINSDNPTCSLNQDGCNAQLYVTGGSINLVGGSSLSSNCPGNIHATYGETTQRQWPPTETRPEPAECDITPAGAIYDSTTKTTTLFPGNYQQLPPANAQGNKVILTSGIYCVNKVLKATNAVVYIEGHDVFFYIKPGGDFSLQGGEAHLDPIDDPNSPYKGMLIYVAPDYSGSPTNCIINGNSNDSITGTIFAPYCNLQINGTSGPLGYQSQLVAYTVTLNGSNTLYISYDPNKNAEDHLPAETGLIR
jgi:Flp pilus assembly protein TadG